MKFFILFVLFKICFSNIIEKPEMEIFVDFVLSTPKPVLKIEPKPKPVLKIEPNPKHVLKKDDVCISKPNCINDNKTDCFIVCPMGFYKCNYWIKSNFFCIRKGFHCYISEIKQKYKDMNHCYGVGFTVIHVSI